MLHTIKGLFVVHNVVVQCSILLVKLFCFIMNTWMIMPPSIQKNMLSRRECTVSHNIFLNNVSYVVATIVVLCHQVYSPTEIDLEFPEYMSHSHEIYVYKNTTSSNEGDLLQAKVSLPVHLRYHQPRLDVQFMVVSLQPPIVMLHCTTCMYK